MSYFLFGSMLLMAIPLIMIIIDCIVYHIIQLILSASKENKKMIEELLESKSKGDEDWRQENRKRDQENRKRDQEYVQVRTKLHEEKARKYFESGKSGRIREEELYMGMSFRSKQFYFQANKDEPNTKTDLFSTNQNYNNEKLCYDDAPSILIKTFNIKMPTNNGYTAHVDGCKHAYRVKTLNNRAIFTNGYDIGVPYKITIISENDGDPSLCDIAIYDTTREKLQESLIKYYEEYLKLGIIVIKYMNYHFSTNDVLYNHKVTTYQ